MWGIRATVLPQCRQSKFHMIPCPAGNVRCLFGRGGTIRIMEAALVRIDYLH